MTPLDLTELRARLREVAAKATPGPWCRGHNPDSKDPVAYMTSAYAPGKPGRVHLVCIPAPGKDMNDEALIVAFTGNGPTSEANALYLAHANPAALLTLLDALDASDAVAKAGADEMALAHEWRRRAEAAEERAAKAEAERDEFAYVCGAVCLVPTLRPGEVLEGRETRGRAPVSAALALLARAERAEARLATTFDLVGIAIARVEPQHPEGARECLRAVAQVRDRVLAATADKGEGEGGDG